MRGAGAKAPGQRRDGSILRRTAATRAWSPPARAARTRRGRRAAAARGVAAAGGRARTDPRRLCERAGCACTAGASTPATAATMPKAPQVRTGRIVAPVRGLRASIAGPCATDRATAQLEPGRVDRDLEALQVGVRTISPPLRIRHDLGAQLAAQRLEPLDLGLQLAARFSSAATLRDIGSSSLLELEHALDAGEVHAQLGRHLLDAPQPLDVLVRVQPRALRRALRLDQARAPRTSAASAGACRRARRRPRS